MAADPTEDIELVSRASADASWTQDDHDGPRAATCIETRFAREMTRAMLFDAALAATRIHHFTLLHRLGAGGMGTVYAAYDERLERKVAIKFLAPDLDDHVLLLAEARALARLNHPNVITVHEVGEHDGRVFVAMEFVAGRTLRATLRGPAQTDERRPTWRDVLELFVQAGRGLAAAHHANIVHHDFKPDNVLVGDDGRVRILDFGLAHALDKAADSPDAPRSPTTCAATGRLVGTPAYMAPEQFAGACASARSDQYSYCAALWEGLYGRRVFTAATTEALKAVVRAGVLPDQPRPSAVPPRVHAIVARGLAREPDDRWPDMNALLAELTRDPPAASRRWSFADGGLALLDTRRFAFVLSESTFYRAATQYLHAAAKTWRRGVKSSRGGWRSWKLRLMSGDSS